MKNKEVIGSMSNLKAIKKQDVTDNRLTYIAPIRSQGEYIKDELMWVEECADGSATVFRCMDGKRHVFNESELKNFRLIAR